MRNVFTYGSLMYDRVWNIVVDGTYEKAAASVKGYDRLSIKDEDYPAMVKSSADSLVKGVLYYNVSEADMAKLDTFEGEFYRRICGVVFISDNDKPVTGDFYIFKDKFRHMVSNNIWNVKEFEESGIFRFLKNYPMF